MKKLKILLADDEETILRLYDQILSRESSSIELASEIDDCGSKSFSDHNNEEALEPLNPSYELTLCRQGLEAVEAVQAAEAANDPFAIAFLDVRMPPGPDGIWTAENIRAICPDTQIVIVTGYSDIDPSDIERRVPPVDRLLYIQKPFHPFEIRQYAATLSARWMAEKKMRRMNEQLESIVDRRTSELKKANLKLEHQATHDSLTELLNRKAIFSALDRELSRMRRTGEPVSLIMADLDHFKLVNDRYGHKAGDDVLIEAAYFDQLSVRNTARKLKLHSPSSFRFERNIDSANLDWASRRVCDLILEIAGGELLDGCLDVGENPASPEPITLRLSQLKRLLGIEIPNDFVAPTLEKLGLKIETSSVESITAVPPSWRKDLTREVDLVEEVGRIYGFEKIPDDINVPMAASYRPKTDRVIDKVRAVLTGAGFDEAVTASLVPEPWSDAFTPWTSAPPLISSQPMLGVLEEYSQNIGAVNLLRRSLIPSLMEVHRINEYRFNSDVNLFEIAKVYLPVGDNQIPDQPTKLALISERGFFAVKGVIETLVHNINSATTLAVRECDHDLLDQSQSGELRIGEEVLGWIGAASNSAKKLFGLRSDVTVVELDLALLEQQAVLIPRHVNQSSFPPVTRDFNFIVENAIRWSDLESTVRTACGPLLESVQYRETFRDEKRDGPNKKRLLLSIVLRSEDSTLTGQEAEEICNSIIASCAAKHSAALVG